MTLILKPKGRGAWHTTRLVLSGSRASSLFIRPGQQIFLGGITFRIVSVEA